MCDDDVCSEVKDEDEEEEKRKEKEMRKDGHKQVDRNR